MRLHALDGAVMCAKHAYASVKAARRAHRKASYRIRVYRCDACHAWHVTNQDKR